MVAGMLLTVWAYTGCSDRERVNNISVPATATSPPARTLTSSPELTSTSPPNLALTSPPVFLMSTVLPPPDPEIQEIFPEYVMHRFTYDETAFPQYAAVLPDAPCATWENGGLSWSYREDLPNIRLGWVASLWLPIYRFCGFPLPYPEKPTQTRIENAPRDWVDWKMTQMAIMPPPTITPAPR